MPDQDKIGLIMRFALLTAGQEDEFTSRQLGPIHLIKYVYLADMEFARYNGGRTFTGTDWIFHNFGPWSPRVHEVVEQALPSWGATRTTLPSKFGNEDYTRWSIDQDPDLLAELTTQLPLEIRHAVSSYVHKFTNDTSSLLHFVYATPPILHAAPGEHLDFGVVVAPPREEAPSQFTPMISRLSKKQTKALQDRMKALRERFTQQNAKPSAGRARPPSMSDAEIVARGVDWLDKIAGEEFPPDGADVTFSDEIWKSKSRRGDA